MSKQDSSKTKFHITGKINVFFIILMLISAVPIAIGFIGIFNQFTQPVILHEGMRDNYDLLDTIDLESNCIYYITVAPLDPVSAGSFTATLKFLKGTEEVYLNSIEYTIPAGQKGIILSFEPFISDIEGSYIIDCTMTFPASFQTFYLKMQQASEITQITGYSGEEILNVGMIIFIAVIVLLIIVSIIARVKYAIRLGRLSAKSEQPQSKFVWKSKDENEDS